MPAIFILNVVICIVNVAHGWYNFAHRRILE